MRILKCAALAITLGFLSLSAQAISTYTDEATFLAALTGTQLTESFETAVWDNAITSPVVSNTLSWTSSSTFTSSATYNHDGTRGIYDFAYDPNNDLIASASLGGDLSGFGGWFRSADVGSSGPASNLNFLLSTGSDYDLTLPGPTTTILGDWVFFGVIDSSGFSNVTISSNGNWGTDDFTFTRTVPIPEPGTGWIALLGFFAIAWIRWSIPP